MRSRGRRLVSCMAHSRVHELRLLVRPEVELPRKSALIVLRLPAAAAGYVLDGRLGTRAHLAWMTGPPTVGWSSLSHRRCHDDLP